MGLAECAIEHVHCRLDLGPGGVGDGGVAFGFGEDAGVGEVVGKRAIQPINFPETPLQ